MPFEKNQSRGLLCTLRTFAQNSWIGVLLCALMLLLLRLPLPWPRSAGFLCVTGIALLGNLFWWGWVDDLLGQSTIIRSAAMRRWCRGAWAIYMALMLAPVILIVIRRGWWDQWPSPLIAWVMLWDLLLAALAVAGSLVKLVFTIAGAFKKARAGSSNLENQSSLPAEAQLPASSIPSAPNDNAQATDSRNAGSLSRRRLLIGAAALPFAATGAAFVAGRVQEGRFLVRRVTLQLPRLPARLKGLTISHVSDLHVGRLFRPEHLPAMVDAVNSLSSDIVVVTGDIIDHSNDFLPDACDALTHLESRHGRFLVPGNHDLIDNSREFVRYVSASEPHFLVDRLVKLDLGGEAIQIAGLGWSPSDAPRRGDPGHFHRASSTLAQSDPNLFTLGLVHHPHAFDALAPLGVDLTLAGHTHGGQLMLTPPGSPFRLGAGSLMFRYIWGQYWKDSAALCVNAGVGNWFPIRINAPAEIVQIRLV